MRSWLAIGAETDLRSSPIPIRHDFLGPVGGGGALTKSPSLLTFFIYRQSLIRGFPVLSLFGHARLAKVR